MAALNPEGPAQAWARPDTAHVTRPAPRVSTVARLALVDRLRAAHHVRAISVRAPAGYGKTTLILQWSQVDDRPFVWVTVDSFDDDPSTFVRRLVSALATVEPVDPELTTALTTVEPRFSSTVLPFVARMVRERTVPFVLIIDDLSEVSSPDALRVLGVVVANLPAESQVVGVGRTAPALPLRRLRAQQDLLELGRDDLALTTPEATALLRSLGLDPDSPRGRGIVERAEGWAAGLYLAAKAAVERGDSPQGLPWEESAVEDVVADYLIDEFLSRTEPATVRFLLETSVLSELSGPVCDAVTRTRGSAALLHELARSNELIVPISAPTETYRYHRLFGGFLQAELRRRHPERAVSLHRRAGRWYRSVGEPHLAALHARAAGDMDLLGGIVWENAAGFLSAGNGDAVRSWIEGLDDRQIGRSCGLILTAAWLALQQGDTSSFARWMAAAEARIPRDGSSVEATYVSGLAVIKAAAGEGGPVEIAERSALAIATAPPDDPVVALAHVLLGAALVLRGREAEGTRQVERGEALARAFDLPSFRAHGLALLGGIALASGEQERGFGLVMQARDVVSASGLEHNPTLAHVFAASALVHAMRGRLAEARRDALHALRQISLMPGFAPWAAMQSRLRLARTFLLLDDAARARVLIEEAGEFRGPATESPVIDRLFRETADLVRRREAGPAAGPSSLTMAEMRLLQFLPSHLTFPQIAQELHVSRHTVKSQAAAAYRKLGVASRDDAVVRARKIGLLPTA